MASLPFQPKEHQMAKMPHFEANNVPRYLFRVHSSTSAGKTDENKVSSQYVQTHEQAMATDMFSDDPESAGRNLNDHLWWHRGHERNCNLMSWTSSLIFALQFCLYQIHCLNNPPDSSDIKLLIVDTRGIPTGSFIKDIEAINCFSEQTHEYPLDEAHSLSRLRRMRKGRNYYFGEYLTQGYLDIQGRCAQTTFQRILDLGLFNLYPELKNKQAGNKWAKAVVELRETCYNMPQSSTPDEIRRAIVIASSCFGGEWNIPVAAMFLSFKKRSQNDEAIRRGFIAMFTQAEIDSLSLQDMRIDSDRLPEVEQFGEIIETIQAAFRPDELDTVTSQMINLNIDGLTQSVFPAP